MNDTNPTERADMLANAIAAKLLGAVNAPEQEIYRISREIAALTSQAAQPAEANGWVMVPREPTAAMVEKFYAATEITREGTIRHFVKGWSAMLAATPKAPATDAGEVRLTHASTYEAFTDGLEAAAEICGSLAETTYDDSDGFEAATGCEAAIMRVVKQQRAEQKAATPPAPNDDLRAALREARTTLSITRTNIMCEMQKGEGTAYRFEGVPEELKKRIDAIDAALKENRRG